MKKFFTCFIALTALFLISCGPKNQPKDPAAWSPLNKKYICNHWISPDSVSPDLYYVIYFYDKNHAALYYTQREDYLPMTENNYIDVNYYCNYPKIRLDFYKQIAYCTLIFSDTTTLTLPEPFLFIGENGPFILLE